MKPAQEKAWLLDAIVSHNDLQDIAESAFTVEAQSPTSTTMVFYDDFDANLWNAQYLFYRIRKQGYQLEHASGSVGKVSQSTNIKFWWDLPDGDVQKTLKKLIGLRAVLPVASLTVEISEFSLRNEDDKRVVKGQLLRSLATEDSNQYLALREMRGYGKDFKSASKLLKPLLGRSVNNFTLQSMLNDLDLVKIENNSITRAHLSPGMPTEVAVRNMGNQMISQAARHIDGIIADIDTVFLHQFRVSVRKLRSLLSLMKTALPPDIVEAVSPRVSAIAGKTSRLRDLDVFLLDKKHYRSMLPDELDEGFSTLFTQVEKLRRKEKTQVARYFSSTEFKKEFNTCAEVLGSEPLLSSPLSKKPVLPFAKSLLLKRYKKMQKMNSRLNTQSDDEDVHDIRKEFKKFRYLIEFFSELLPGKQTRRLVAELKTLQLTLGQFNDYCVQIEFLGSLSDDRQIEMTKVLSGLIAILHLKQAESRQGVEAALAKFFTRKMTAEIELAFGRSSGGKLK